MDMKKILQAVDGIATKPVEGSDSMARFLRVVKEAEINQPTAMPQTAPAPPYQGVTVNSKPYVHAPGPDDPNFERYVYLMWKYEFLDNERTGKGNLIKVDVAVSDESNAEIDRLKYEAEKLAGPNLPAWEKARIGYQTDPEYIKYSQDMAAKMSAELLEAEINQPAAKKPGMPTADEINKIKATIPQLPAQDGDLGDGRSVTTNRDGTRSYSSAEGTFTYDAQGKAITYSSPNFAGHGLTLDLTTNQSTYDYNAGPLSTTHKWDDKGRPITTRLGYNLGVATLGAEQDHVSGIRSTEVAPRVGDGTDTAATLAAAHQIMPTSAIAGARGVDPKKFAAFQQQNPTAVKENSLSKFLSIVDNNNVGVLNEGAGPHRVALPVQMAMQHYQQPATKPQPRERLIDKYFTEAETEITQRKEEKRAKINQYASVIAERVMMKESKQGVTEGESNAMDTVAKRLTDPKDGMTAKLRAAGDKRREDKLKGRNISRRDTTSKDEWGDLKELSTDLLRDYKTAAGADAKAADAAGDFERGNKRFKGINKATIKQFDNDAKKHKELAEAADPAQFAKPPQVPQVPAKDGMYGSWEFTTRKDGDRSATHPQHGTFIWDNSGAGGALRPITWSLPSNSIPGMSWVTDFVSGTHTLEATGKLAGGNLEYQGKMQTKLDGTPISGSVGLKGYGHDANYTADYANNNTTGTVVGPQVKQEGLEQLLALRNKIDEAIKQRLDPKCWKGKHKQGTKVKGGVRVNNCVPNKK